MKRGISPYRGCPVSSWSAVTRQLIDAHPFDKLDVLDIAQTAWKGLWKTKLGSGKKAIPLSEVEVPASVVGYLFEVFVGQEIKGRFPGVWRRGQTASEKDLVCVSEDQYSIEIKTSGQLGDKVFGNRSYGQKRKVTSQEKKEKSGYYITVNFFQQTLTLLRFGWIDADDWKAQHAPTGQMAGLDKRVYEHKLVVIPGAYRLLAPVNLLPNVGPQRAEQLEKLGIKTIRDLIRSHIKLPSELLNRVREEAISKYG